MIVNCTANTVENLFTSPTVTWFGPSGNELPAEGRNNLVVSNQTKQLVLDNVTPNNRGVYKCRVVVNIPEAFIKNHFDEITITANPTQCEFKIEIYMYS